MYLGAIAAIVRITILSRPRRKILVEMTTRLVGAETILGATGLVGTCRTRGCSCAGIQPPKSVTASILNNRSSRPIFRTIVVQEMVKALGNKR